MNQLDNEKQVLKAVQNLVRASYLHRKFAVAISEYIAITSLLPVSKLEYWDRTFRHQIWLEALSARSHRSLIPWLDICSGDGYRREKLLLSSSEGAPNGFLFAIVLRRLNDWVPQVRAAARGCIPRIAANTEPEYILEALWAILPHLYTWGRLQIEELEVLLNLLAVDGVPSRLASRLTEVTAGPAASILGQAGRKPVLDPFLPILSDNAVQPAVRAKAYRSQLEERIKWFEGRKWVWTDIRWCLGRYEPVLGEREIHVYRPFSKTLERAARDKSSIVRRVAGDALMSNLDRLGADALPIAEMLSEDVYPSVAERGKYAVQQIHA